MSSQRPNLLLVDDDPSVLSATQRRLGEYYDVEIACGGEQGLEVLANSPPFPVIISDMEMPGMDGIQFIQAARRDSPNSIYLMMTGNQDQATASRAMNEGGVFRFLTKPCSFEEIHSTIEAALRQYNLVNAEKQLLQKTLIGAIDAIVDIFETMIPNGMIRSSSIQKIVRELLHELQLPAKWEFVLSSRLALIGYGLVSKSYQDASTQQPSHECDDLLLLTNACLTSARILQRIPRLSTPATIIQQAPDSVGYIPKDLNTEAEVIQLGATVLRVALEWENSQRLALSPTASVLDLRRKMPHLPEVVIEALDKIQLEHVAPPKIMEIPIPALKSGMVLRDDIFTQEGNILIGKGRRLTASLIEKLTAQLDGKNNLKQKFVTVVLPEVASEIS